MPRTKKVDIPFSESNNSSVKNDENDKSIKIDNIIEDFKSENEQSEIKSEKRGRKKKIDEVEKESFTAIASINASIFLDFLVARMPKPAPLTANERESFDKAFTQLVTKYYDNFQKYGVEVNFSLAFLFIIIQRIDLTKIIKRNKEKHEKDSNNIREIRNRQDEFSETVDKDNRTTQNYNS